MAINWGLLFAKGRCKAMGVSWNEEELNAIHKLQIPVEFVRLGVLTLEEYKLELNTKENPNLKMLNQMKKEHLVQLAKELGLEVPNESKRVDLISLIQNSKLPAPEHSDKQESLVK